jgi:eukaryotic-like serine/threonine-protein kinase
MVRDAGRYRDKQLGNYRLLQRLGKGAFAEVYLGQHIHLDTPAAIKVLTTTLTEDEVRFFREEARTVRNLKHPHILPVLDFSMEGSASSLTPYIVMEYAPNGTLRQRHFRNVRIPLLTIISYVKQVASALQYVHGQRLIHRDIKPENLLIGVNNEILVSDFGIATGVRSSRKGEVQNIAGTVYYMAPEQITGTPQPASDQYALGVVVYEWLVGTPPFTGTYDEIIARHLSAPPPPLHQHGMTLPLEVEEVVMKALAKDYHQRFASIEAFALALENSLSTGTPSTHSLSQRTTLPPTIPPVPPIYISTYDGHTAPIWTVAWSPDMTHIASGGQDRTAQVWETKTGHCSLTYTEHSSLVWSVVWSTDGSLIASAGDDNSVQIWQSRSGRQIFSYQSAPDRLWTMAWSPDNSRIATANNDGVIRVWHALNGQQATIYREHAARVHALAWSPDNSRIASADYQGTVQIWNSQTGQRTLLYSGHVHTPIYALAWSPDNSRIASAGYDGVIQIWNVLNGRLLQTYRGHAAAVYSVAWSPDAKLIASASDDHTVQIWQSLSGNLVFTYRKHTAPVRSAAWSANGVLIASGALDGTVHIWQTS